MKIEDKDAAFKEMKIKVNEKLGAITLTKKEKIIYFAYGSNMLHSRLQKRVPSAIPLGVAKLDNYSLVWHKESKDGSAKCDIIPSNPNDDIPDEVYGVLYEFDPAHKAALDKAEGLGFGYNEKEVKVLYKDHIVTAKTYYAIDIAKKLLPYEWYKAFVVTGAKSNNLPIEYIKLLVKQMTKQDKDTFRKNENQEILNSLKPDLKK
ncbi:MAG TPA: gamma-glutamylcyclotransferase family protein [Victivallales bacterium]|nr:gamma-glutamylcyclotransferase family protein [Victivallales bacterium]